MSKSEIKFGKWAEKMFKGAFIQKVSDFKQLGHGGNKGMPDFLIIKDGIHLWYEVKYVKSLKTFNFKEINENQWIMFAKMLKKGGKDVILAIYDGQFKLHLKYYSELLNMRLNGGKKWVFG